VKKNRSIVVCLSLLVVLAACSSPEKKTRKMQAAADSTAEQIKQGEDALVDKGKAYNFATGIALNRATNTEPAIEVAKDMNAKSQVLLGPPKPDDAVTMTKIVDGKLSSDEGEQKKAEKLESKFLDVIAKIQKEKDENEAKHAKELAALKEQNAQNADDAQKWRDYQRKHWLKRIIASIGFTGLIAGLIALVIFVPVSIPILTRIAGALLKFFPAMGKVFGVVGMDTVDATVKGIGNIRSKLKLKPDEVYTAEAVRKLMDTELRDALDRHHKDLIEERRKVVAADAVHV
jgi:hypothetical protein